MDANSVDTHETAQKRVGRRLKPTQLYRHYNAKGELLYVGISLSTVHRLGQHKKNSDWFYDIARIDIENFDSWEEAYLAESEAIQAERPLYNKQKAKYIGKPTQTEKRAKRSREELEGQLVSFNPVYTLKEVGQVLGCGATMVARLIELGEIQTIQWDRYGNGDSVVERVTGWQLINFLERKAAMSEGGR